jgi:hypothetical protein
MRQQRHNRLQRTHRSRRTARQIHNQRCTARTANRTAQRSQRSMFQPRSTHPFRHPINQPVTDQPRSLRSYVPRSQPSPSGGHNQPYNFCVTSQRLGDQIQLIGQRLRGNAHSGGLQQLPHHWPRNVDLLSPGAAIADRQHNSGNIPKEILTHPSSLSASVANPETLPMSSSG